MPTKVKIDFYAVKMPDGSESFESLVKKDAASKDDETRNADVGGFPVRLQQAHFTKEFIEADMLRIQMSDLPPKAKLSGKVGNLGLADDEGLGGETAFLYHPGTKVIAVQRNRGGVSARMLTEYFQTKFALNGPIEAFPVVLSDAIKRLSAMKETKRLRIRFAGITNPNFFRNRDSSLAEMIDVLEAFRAPSGTFELSMGRQPGSLLAKRIVALARHVVGMSPPEGEGDVTTMEVSGVLDDDTRDEFDVLMYRMVEVVMVQEDQHRRSTYKNRRPEILQAWRHREKELKEMFGS